MNKIALILISITFLSCGNDLEISGFNSDSFKNAKKSCDSTRLELIHPLKEHQSLFIGAKEGAIKQLLGRPDEQEILARMSRKYYYYLTPSYKCDSSITGRPPSIVIDFEHMGRAKLVIIPSVEAIKAKK